jgi:hypothetical protein
VTRNHRAAIPAYINLAQFALPYEPTTEGLVHLLDDAIKEGCPRYDLRYDSTGSTQGLFNELIVEARSHQRMVLLVLDGMDEMAPADFTQRVSAVADLLDTLDPNACHALVTCRYSDFVKLSDYTNTFHAQRLDLLPWTRDMVRTYLDSQLEVQTPDRVKALQAVATTILERHTQYFQPLEVALVMRVLRHRSANSMSALWADYVREQVNRSLSDTTLTADVVILELARLAYNQVWPSSDFVAPDAQIILLGCRASLLRVTEGRHVFEIRPLLDHLVASSILLRLTRTGRLPKEFRIDDVNTREIAKSVSEQAGIDPKWVRVVVGTLAAPGDQRTHGDRLAFAAYCLSREQLASSVELRQATATLIHLLITGGDDVERERALDAIERQPALLPAEDREVGLFFGWIVTSGSIPALIWLIRLLYRDKQLRRRHRHLWRDAWLRTIDEGRFGRTVALLITQGRRVSQYLWWVIDGARYACLSAACALVFEVTFLAALALAVPVFSFLPSAPRLRFQPLWELHLFVADYGFQIDSLISIGWILVVRHYLLAAQREGLGPMSWRRRVASLLVLAFGYQCLGFIVFEAVHLSRGFANWFVDVDNALIAVTVALMVLSSTPVRRLISRIRAPHRQRGESDRVDREVVITDVKESDPKILSSADVVFGLRDFASAYFETEKVRRVGHRHLKMRGLGYGAGILAMLTIGFLAGGLGGLLIAVCVGLAGGVGYAWFIQPMLACRRVKREIQENVRAGLNDALDRSFRAALREISDRRNSAWVRKAYVDSLKEVRFDAPLYALLERVYSSLEVGVVKDNMTQVVAQAYHELQKTDRGRRRVKSVRRSGVGDPKSREG